MKLHIQLEPFNGKKFDFVEVEVNTVQEIEAMYAMIEQLRNQPAPTNTYQAPTTEGVAMKYKKNGEPMTTKDKVHMTVAMFEKALELGKPTDKAPWLFYSNELK